jgi:hypothetical protein
LVFSQGGSLSCCLEQHKPYQCDDVTWIDKTNSIFSIDLASGKAKTDSPKICKGEMTDPKNKVLDEISRISLNTPAAKQIQAFNTISS